MISQLFFIIFFFFNDTATTEIYTLSLHDALPIYTGRVGNHLLAHSLCTEEGRDKIKLRDVRPHGIARVRAAEEQIWREDRKSTRLNSSHGYISYAVFCLKKKTNKPSTYMSNTANI